MKYEKRDSAYYVSTDNGPYKISPHVVGINITFTDVRLLAIGGTDKLGEKSEPEYQRVINAGFTVEHGHFEIISEEGEKRNRSPAFTHIMVADFENSSLAHFPETRDMEEQFYLTLCLTQEWFDWLWEEIKGRPNATVGARLHIMPWLASIEASMWYEDKFRSIRLEHDNRIKVLDANFYVGDLEPKTKLDPATGEELEDNGAPPPTFSEKLERELETTDAGIWAKRIFWVLVIIAGLLLFHR